MKHKTRIEHFTFIRTLVFCWLLSACFALPSKISIPSPDDVLSHGAAEPGAPEADQFSYERHSRRDSGPLLCIDFFMDTVYV